MSHRFGDTQRELKELKELFVIVSKSGGLKYYRHDYVRYVVPVYRKNIKLEYRCSYNPEKGESIPAGKGTLINNSKFTVKQLLKGKVKSLK